MFLQQALGSVHRGDLTCYQNRLSTARFVCMTFTPQIKNKHQELEGLCFSDKAASMFEDGSVNETTVGRAPLGGRGVCLYYFYVSWSY